HRCGNGSEDEDVYRRRDPARHDGSTCSEKIAAMDLPIVCTLTESELQERRQTILSAARNAVLETTSIANGYTYEFALSPQILEQLARLVELERQCCRFLDFQIIVEAAAERVRLEVTGPPAAKALI